MLSVLLCNLVDHDQVCAGRQTQGLEVSILLGNIVGSAEHKIRSSCLRTRKTQSCKAYDFNVGNRTCGIFFLA